MKRYVAVFTGSPASTTRWKALPESERQQRTTQGMAAWKEWVSDNKAHIIEISGPLGSTKLVYSHGIMDTRSNLTGLTIIQAESHEAAAKLFLHHPYFLLFLGDWIEVMEILPIPEEQEEQRSINLVE